MTKTTLASLLATAAGLLAIPADGHAATAGSDLTRPAATTLECAASCTLAWGAPGWFDNRLDQGSIVTRWSAHLAPGTRARLRLVRREDSTIDGPVTGVAASEWVTGSAAGGLQSFTTHLPVSEYGLRVGLDVEGGGLGLATDGQRDFGVVRVDPALGAGETRSGEMRSGEPLMQATTEGDADADGLGDVSEDDCVFCVRPAPAAPSSPAPAPAPDPAPPAAAPVGGGAGTGAPGVAAATTTQARPAFQVDTRGLLRAGAKGRQGWFDVFVLNDSARPFDAAVVVKAGGRRVGSGSVKGLEGGDAEKLAVRLGRRERRTLQRTGKVKLTLEGSATLANGHRHELRQALTVLPGGDSRYDGTYRGPGPFVLVVERGTVRTINARVLGFCPETSRQQSLNIFTVNGFPALVRRDGTFDVTGNAVSQSNTYRGRLSLKGTGRGYASAFKTHLNMSSGGRLLLEGCTGATNWTVKRARR